jgi:hypothetical protein
VDRLGIEPSQPKQLLYRQPRVLSGIPIQMGRRQALQATAVARPARGSGGSRVGEASPDTEAISKVPRGRSKALSDLHDWRLDASPQADLTASSSGYQSPCVKVVRCAAGVDRALVLSAKLVARPDPYMFRVPALTRARGDRYSASSGFIPLA